MIHPLVHYSVIGIKYVRYCDGMSLGGDVTNPIVNSQNSSEL